MGIQCKPRAGLLDVMESQAGGKVPEKTTQAKLPPPPPTQPLHPDPVDCKRKRDKKSHDVVEGGKGPLSKEVETKKKAKQTRVTQTLVDRKCDS